MSANTSFGRLAAGVQAGNYGISQAVDPTKTLRDPRQLVGSRKQRAAAIQPAGGAVSPLAGLAGITDAVIASAKGPRLSQQANQQQQERQQQEPGKLTLGDATNIAAQDLAGVAGSAASRVRNGAANAAEWGRQKMMQSTLSGLTDQAEAKSVGSQRHGVMFPDGSVASSTADTRGFNGPLGSAGIPAGGIGVPPTFRGIGGAF